jgi:hypothetical protein
MNRSYQLAPDRPTHLFYHSMVFASAPGKVIRAGWKQSPSERSARVNVGGEGIEQVKRKGVFVHRLTITTFHFIFDYQDQTLLGIPT